MSFQGDDIFFVKLGGVWRWSTAGLYPYMFKVNNWPEADKEIGES